MLSEFRSTHITWDKATSRIYSPVTANASDENGRKLVVQIVNSGQVEDLTGATLHLYWETRDKTHHGLDVFDAVDLKKGEFELSYTTGMLSNKGVLNANLVLIDTVGRVVSERFKITVTEGIDNDAIQSENSFSSLTQALIDVGPRLNDLTAQLQQKATKEDVANIGNASPKGVYETLIDLQTAYPTGTNGIYVVKADGYWYYWNGSTWTAGGIYQSTVTSLFPATNMIVNGDFSNGTTNWGGVSGTIASVNGELEYTVSSLSSSARIQQTTTTPIVGHKYYLFGVVKPKYSNPSAIPRMNYGGQNIFLDGEIITTDFKRYSGIITASGTDNRFYFFIPTQDDYAIGDKIYFKNIGIIDLTATFGNGKEPTIEEMETYMSKYPNKWFNGTTGEIISFKEVAQTVQTLDSDTLDNRVTTVESDVTSIKSQLDTQLGEVVRPKGIPCVVGKTLNIWYENILRYQTPYSVSVVDSRNLKSFKEVAIINPTTTSIIASNVRAMMGNQPLFGNGTTNIIPVATDAGSGETKKVLFIGDSITNDGRYENELINLFSADVMNIELLGTKQYRTNELARHEGYAGWAAEDFITKAEFGGVPEQNPFWDGSKFDFTHYMTQQGYTDVDYVFINLGTNDTVASRNYNDYPKIIGYYNTMINSIKAYDPNIKIVIGMTILQSTLSTETFFSRNVVLGLIKAFKNEYEPKELEGIYLSPNYINVDPKRDFNTEDVVINPRNTETVTAYTDATHPNTRGHEHMADVFYSFIKYLATLN